jgi:hypothetical protein
MVPSPAARVVPGRPHNLRLNQAIAATPRAIRDHEAGSGTVSGMKLAPACQLVLAASA